MNKDYAEPLELYQKGERLTKAAIITTLRDKPLRAAWSAGSLREMLAKLYFF